MIINTITQIGGDKTTNGIQDQKEYEGESKTNRKIKMKIQRE